MNVLLRQAADTDRQAIRDTVMAAFGDVEGQEIADLVTVLPADPSAQPSLSLVAVVDDRIAGHILFTKVRLRESRINVVGTLLAPLAVHPEFQNRGLGGRLIKEGLSQLKTAGVEFVFVLGHPGYYTKFGFFPAGAKGFEAPYPIPSEQADAWMVMALRPGLIGEVRGQVVCAESLDDPKYWQE